MQVLGRLFNELSPDNPPAFKPSKLPEGKMVNRKILLTATAAFVALTAPFIANAGDSSCYWGNGNLMNTEAVNAKTQGMGHKIRSVKKERGCYEANQSHGGILFGAVTGELVKTKSKS